MHDDTLAEIAADRARDEWKDNGAHRPIRPTGEHGDRMLELRATIAANRFNR